MSNVLVYKQQWEREEKCFVPFSTHWKLKSVWKEMQNAKDLAANIPQWAMGYVYFGCLLMGSREFNWTFILGLITHSIDSQASHTCHNEKSQWNFGFRGIWLFNETDFNAKLCCKLEILS